jgi:hypothetical protein
MAGYSIRLLFVIKSAMGITFNSRFGHQQFSEPNSSFLLPGSGLYVVLAPDTTATPRPFLPLYFGETGDFTRRITKNHEHCDDWRRHTNELYFAQLFMPGSTQAQRREIEQALIEWYAPPCNETGLAASRYRPVALQPSASISAASLPVPSLKY